MRYASGSQAKRSMSYMSCRGESWNASRALQLLDGHTVIVTGNSMTINLFCALTCALMQAPNATVTSTQVPSQKDAGKGFDQAIAQNRMTIEAQGWQSHWMLPSCASGSQRWCFWGHGIGPDLTALRALASKTVNTPFVVLLDAGGARFNRGAQTFISALRNTGATNADLAQWSHLPFNSSAVFSLAARKRRYEAAVKQATTSLERLQAQSRSNVAILVESVPDHFPGLPACLEAAIAGCEGEAARCPEGLREGLDVHDWDGYVLGNVEMVRWLLHRPQGEKVLNSMRLSVSNFTNVKAGFVHSRLLAARRAKEACEAKHNRLSKSGRPVGYSLKMLPQRQKPPSAQDDGKWCTNAMSVDDQCWIGRIPTRLTQSPTGPSNGYEWRSSVFYPGACAPRQKPMTAGAKWRQIIERRAAADTGIALLQSSDAREERWDMHPGVQRTPPGYADCKHSTLDPGAYDAEAISFLLALENRLGGAK
jgi:hypothetical protein